MNVFQSTILVFFLSCLRLPLSCLSLCPDCSCIQEDTTYICSNVSSENIQDSLENLRGPKKLVIRGNELRELPEDFWNAVNETKSLESIDLSNNLLSEFVVDTEVTLKFLNVSGNQLRSINLRSLLENLPELQVLDLSRNHISSLGLIPPSIIVNKLEIILDQNPIRCDRNDQKWLLKWTRRHPNVFSQSSRCHPESVLPNISLREAAQTACSVCQCFFNSTRPKNPMNNLTVSIASVNCSNLGLKKLPEKLPPQTKVVHMENNEIKDLTFTSDWSSVLYLFLSNNTIENLRGFEGNPFVRSLRSLDLSQNRLTSVESYVLKHLSLDHVYLKHNPWRCDCNVIPFQLWIQEHGGRVQDIDEVRCATYATRGARNGVDSFFERKVHDDLVNEKLHGKVIYKIPKSDLCPQPQVGNHKDRFLEVISMILAVLTVTIILKTGYDWWWQKRTGKLPQFFKINV